MWSSRSRTLFMEKRTDVEPLKCHLQKLGTAQIKFDSLWLCRLSSRNHRGKLLKICMSQCEKTCIFKWFDMDKMGKTREDFSRGKINFDKFWYFFGFQPNRQSVFLMSPPVVFPASLSPGFILFLGQLTGAHVFRALVVVCNEPSQINAACCHMRDWITTSNTEQMDTRVSLKTIFHWCCKLLSYCQ